MVLQESWTKIVEPRRDPTIVDTPEPSIIKGFLRERADVGVVARALLT